MIIPAGKKVVCITGTVWTGKHHAPRHLLCKDGFERPTWFTTRTGITDADYKKISSGDYHLALSNDEILVHIKYGSDYIGIMKDDFLQALELSPLGVLVVGPQEIASQLGQKIPSTTIFALKDEHMRLSRHLSEVNKKGQLHRIDVDVQKAGAWEKVHDQMRELLNLV